VFKIGFCRCGSDREVGSGDEGEEHDETEERGGEEEVDTKRAYQEDKAGEYPAW
jgi:hypothetical protein